MVRQHKLGDVPTSFKFSTRIVPWLLTLRSYGIFFVLGSCDCSNLAFFLQVGLKMDISLKIVSADGKHTVAMIERPTSRFENEWRIKILQPGSVGAECYFLVRCSALILLSLQHLILEPLF